MHLYVFNPSPSSASVRLRPCTIEPSLSIKHSQRGYMLIRLDAPLLQCPSAHWRNPVFAAMSLGQSPQSRKRLHQSRCIFVQESLTTGSLYSGQCSFDSSSGIIMSEAKMSCILLFALISTIILIACTSSLKPPVCSWRLGRLGMDRKMTEFALRQTFYIKISFHAAAALECTLQLMDGGVRFLLTCMVDPCNQHFLCWRNGVFN